MLSEKCEPACPIARELNSRPRAISSAGGVAVTDMDRICGLSQSLGKSEATGEDETITNCIRADAPQMDKAGHNIETTGQDEEEPASTLFLFRGDPCKEKVCLAL